MKRRLPLRAVRAAQTPKTSQSQIARRAGMRLFRYWQIENGEGNPPTPGEREAIAAALGVRLAEVEWPSVHAVKAS